MKRIAKILPVLALALVLAIGQVVVASGSSYKYTIKVYSGNQGTFADGSTVKEYNVEKGKRVNLNSSDLKVKIKNDKYFAKGFKAVGDDFDKKDVYQGLLTNPVTEDAEYVVVYGLKKDMVKYTVKYRDGKEKKLRKDDVYNGVVGDKPVVSYKYVEGYVPTAYNETKTLSKDPKRNVFVFYYNKVVTERRENSSSNQSSARNDSSSGNNGNNNNANTATGNNGAQTVDQAQNIDDQNADDNGAGDTDDNANDANADNDNGGNNDQPEELVDLDDNEVPLASGNNNKDKKDAGFWTAQTAIIAAIAAVIVALLIFFIVKRKKNQA